MDCVVFDKTFPKSATRTRFFGRVNVAVGCDCVVNGGETMRNVATNGGKKTLERNLLPKKGKENCFQQQSFDCLLNDRKRAVYCHLGMKLACCMLDKSRREGGNWQGDK